MDKRAYFALKKWSGDAFLFCNKTMSPLVYSQLNFHD